MRMGVQIWTLALLAGAVVARPAVARAAGEAPAIDPAGPHALGQVFTAGPTRTGPTLLMSGGYGYTEAVLGNGDAHHRAAGALALHERPVPWLDLALRFDGRYDAHRQPGQPGDTGFVGDPRAYVRADLGFDGGLRLGARLGVWLPGRNAPSLDAGAISPELVGAVSYAPPEGAFALTLNAGYRVDRSAHSAPDPARLSPPDRLALGVSTFDAVLIGAAGTVGRGPIQGFVEASWQLLVGAGHPSALASPIVAGAGVRVALGPRLRLEAEAEVSPSRRPDLGPTAPLVPVPPRVAGWLGLCYWFGAAPAPSASTSPVEPSPPPPPEVEAAPAPAPPETAGLRGRVSAAGGGKLSELRVAITSGDSRHVVEPAEDGRFSFEGKAGDEVVVSVEAAGHLPAQVTATLATGSPTELDVTLEKRPPRGQLRGLVRSLKGAAVSAEVRVEPDGPPQGAPTAGEIAPLRTAGGRFELDIPPGHYRVTISAQGYATQKRQVEVEENGVTLLNVDLRPGR